MMMRELNSAEIAGVAGGSVIQDPNNPWFQLDKDKNPFHSQAEHGGVTSNFENSSGGVTTVHIPGASLAGDGSFNSASGQIWTDSGSWLAEQQRLEWCAMGQGYQLIGGAITGAGAYAAFLDGPLPAGEIVFLGGAAISGIGIAVSWANGC